MKHKENEEFDYDGDPNEEWAKCHERFKACARFELVPQESNEWIALILIIVFCVLIIIIILAVIIYCCIKNKCCGKYTTVPVDPEEKPLGILTEQTMLLGLVCRYYFSGCFVTLSCQGQMVSQNLNFYLAISGF